MWLPWCVSRDDATVPITHLPAEHPNARQLKFADLDSPDVQLALRWQQHRGDTSWGWILRHAEAFKQALGRGEPIVLNEDAAVLELDGATMFCEGCHRASGLYVASIDTFEIRATVMAPEGAWDAYRNANLRAFA